MAVGTAGPRVAFLHGLFGQGRNWTQIAKAVAGPDGTRARCLLVDLPDHGRSPGRAVLLRGLCRPRRRDARGRRAGGAVGARRALAGGKVAMVTTLTYPDLVRSLVVVDIAPRTTATSTASSATSTPCAPCPSASSPVAPTPRSASPQPSPTRACGASCSRTCAAAADLVVAGQPRPVRRGRRAGARLAHRRLPGHRRPALGRSGRLARRRRLLLRRTPTPSRCGPFSRAPGPSSSRASATGCTPRRPRSSPRPCGGSLRQLVAAEA